MYLGDQLALFSRSMHDLQLFVCLFFFPDSRGDESNSEASVDVLYMSRGLISMFISPCSYPGEMKCSSSDNQVGNKGGDSG